MNLLNAGMFLALIINLTALSCQKDGRKAQLLRLNEQFNAEKADGVDFVAVGSKKEFTLLVDFQGESVLYWKKDTIPLSGESVTFNKGEVSITTNHKSDNLHFMSSQVVCDENLMAYKSQLEIGNKEIESCSVFLNQRYELMGKWALVQGDSVAPSVSINFKSQRKVLGNGGCNQFFGHYSADQNQIYFGAISSTGNDCPDDFFESFALSDISSFTIRNGILELGLSTDEKIQFRRVLK